MAVRRLIFICICDFIIEDGREKHQEKIKEGLEIAHEV